MGNTVYLTRASLPPYEEYIKEIKTLWDSHWITTFGPKHKELEKQLMSFLDCARVSLFSNGHSALEMTLQAMGLKGEVITTPFTFASTTNAIVRNGLTPVFCDILPDTCNLDPDKIEELVSEKTCAILPVHVYGNVCNIEKISAIAQKYNLKVIYDAAHAFGVKYKGKSIATYGDASIFSFHASKVYNTAEGGAVCYNDVTFGDKLECIRNFGLVQGDGIFPAGNGKMSELSAALGICNLRHFEECIYKRKKLTNVYIEKLLGVEEISFQIRQNYVMPNYAYFPIKVCNSKVRDILYSNLQKNGILCQKHFEINTNLFFCYRGMYKGDTPIAKEIAGKMLLLPLYSDLRVEQVEFICELIHQILKDIR